MGIRSANSQHDRSGKGSQMLEEARKTSPDEGDYVEFAAAGASARGAFHCAECGYGVTVHATLPICPMCAGTTWEPVDWSPFTRARLQA
jgi:rubredoxin